MGWLSKIETIIGDNSPNEDIIPLPSDVKTFYIQYNKSFQMPEGRDFYIYDIFNYKASQIRKVLNSGKTPIGYVSSQFEDFRPDSHLFDPSWFIGGLDGWQGEFILHPRHLDKVLPIMEQRFLLMRKKGFKIADIDNIDVYHYHASEGDAKTCAKYWNMMAEIARGMGLQVGLKNSAFLFGKVDPDICITESAFVYNEIESYLRFNVPVLNTEYSRMPYEKALRDNRVHSLLKRKLPMDAWEG